MKIVVIGATGGIGRELVGQALEHRHTVVAVSRAPRDFPTGVETVAVDLSQPDAARLEEAVRGADAVVSGLGPRSAAEAGVAERGTQAVVEAMRATGVHRIVVVSAAPIGTVPTPGNPNPPRHDPGDGFVMRHLMVPIVKRILRKHYADVARMEDVVRGSGLDWTIVRPPQLTDKPRTGSYRTAIGRNVSGGMKIARADVAELMLGTLAKPDTVGRILAIAY